MLKIDSQFDSLQVKTYQQWARDYKFDFCATSPPFDMLDIILPLLERTFPISFVHVPSWYVGDANNHRHAYLSALTKLHKFQVLNITYVRNKTLGRYCCWLVIGDAVTMQKAMGIPSMYARMPYVF